MSTWIEPASAQVVITGGSDGIGLALAARFLALGSRVMVTGRSASRLERTGEQYPGLLTFSNDLRLPAERERLATHVRKTMPGLNVLINNAGTQRRVALAEDHAPWAEQQQEMDLLLAAPVHLNQLLIPLILGHGRPGMIVNVTSGGAYVPQPFAPLYSACKAALHSHTVNLAFALTGTTCRVIELAPPAVQTRLAGMAMSHGVPVGVFADAVMPPLLRAEHYVGFGATASPEFDVPRRLYEALFSWASSRVQVPTYTQQDAR